VDGFDDAEYFDSVVLFGALGKFDFFFTYSDKLSDTI
jgi:hypothetical protein